MRRLALAALLALSSASVVAQNVVPSVVAGIDAYNHNDIPGAYRLLKAASDAGDSDAQVNLGYL
jgi:TPR repeat protein